MSAGLEPPPCSSECCFCRVRELSVGAHTGTSGPPPPCWDGEEELCPNQLRHQGGQKNGQSCCLFSSVYKELRVTSLLAPDNM